MQPEGALLDSFPRHFGVREGTMKSLVFALAALSLLSTVIPAEARCPPGTAYQCTQGYGGKVVCGCR